MPPNPPRRGPPGGLLEVNAAQAPHTPVPPPLDNAPTARPPAMPMPPPRHLAKPRVVVPPLAAPRSPGFDEDAAEHTTLGLGPSSAPPAQQQLSGELAVTARELAAERAQREQLERKLADFEERLERRTAESERAPTPIQWKSLAFKLVAGLVAFVAAATVALEAYTLTLRQRVDTVQAKQTTQEAVNAPLPSKVSELELGKVAWRDYAKAKEAYDRAVFAKAGIVLPAPEGAAQAPALEFDQVPMRKPGVVTGGPLVRVKTLPPPLP